MLGIRKLFGSKTDFRSLVQSGAVILDVRTPAEYKTGHIKGSVNIPVDQVGAHITDLKKKNKPVITCCRSGARSAMAASVLKTAGIEAFNGGAWNELSNKI
ncbi:MAG TPA: rhodanese-like domain-containing protein [Agriterribacter sp.]|nr:rhodanese-like domain-containing protein [Agriterribacter sp.]